MKVKIKNSMWVIVLGIITILFTVSIVKSDNSNIVQTSSQAGDDISNKKIGWGIKREDNHKQPDVGKENQKILEENDGICLGNINKKNIYLTFDEGYEAGYTSGILETLKQNDVKATFFITAHYLNTQPELVQQMLEEGHIVGNHTVNHKSMPTLSKEKMTTEIMDLHKAIYEKFQYEMKYLRPPMGEFSENSLSIIKGLGYKTTMWSFAYDDWDEEKQGREEYGKNKILENIHNGAIILLHANSKDNCNILDSVIKEIKEMGYEFKTLDEFKK